MKKRYLAVNILFFAAIMAADAAYALTNEIAVKAAASLLFTAECAFNMVVCARKKAGMKFPILLLSAVVLACAADITLNFKFIVGMLLFGIGHILYFISYCVREKFSPRDFIPAAVSIAGLLAIILFAPILDFGGDTFMQTAVCVYAAIISVMVGKSLSDAFHRRTSLNILIAAGSVLFWISDFALMFSKFGKVPFAGLVCLFTYYPAQFVLALSPLVYALVYEKSAEKSPLG